MAYSFGLLQEPVDLYDPEDVFQAHRGHALSQEYRVATRKLKRLQHFLRLLRHRPSDE